MSSSGFRLDRDDVDFEVKRGSGPGGQHRNKVETTVTAIHQPTGESVTVDGRSQWQNKESAFRELERRLGGHAAQQRHHESNAERVSQIADDRTFNWCGWRDEVVNHRTGARASMAKALRGKFGRLIGE